MDKTLQEKLRAILQQLAVKNIGREHPTLVSDEVAQILQAFKDAGYRRSMYAMQWEGKKTIHTQPKMTGQEFYDRFKAELDTLYKGKLADDGYYLSIHAARSAAGITENQEGRDE